MIFINPKTDFAFKTIFGSEQSRGILISFLNGILYAGQPTIQDLDILNPYQAPKIRGVKDTYRDVKARLVTGKTVIHHARDLTVAPPTMGDVAEIQQAFAMANHANLSCEELDELEHQVFFYSRPAGCHY